MVKQKKVTKAQIKKLERLALKKQDKIWADSVKERDGWKCTFCNSVITPNAAHIIPREIKKFRHNIDNGITLCPKHHKFSFEFSAHQNPFAFLLWFANFRTEQFTKIVYAWEHYLEELAKNKVNEQNLIK